MSSETLKRMSNERQRYDSRGRTRRKNAPPKKRKRISFSIGMGIDLPFLIILLVLLVTGLIMMFSASYAVAYYNQGDSFFFLKRQLIFAVIGFVLMMGISYIDYHSLHHLCYVFLGLSYLALFLVLLLPPVNNVHRRTLLGG